MSRWLQRGNAFSMIVPKHNIAKKEEKRKKERKKFRVEAPSAPLWQHVPTCNCWLEASPA